MLTDELLSLADAGVTMAEIAERFGVTRNTIAGRIYRARNPRQKQPPRPRAVWTQEIVVEVGKMMADGMTEAAIAEKCDCNVDALKKMIHRERAKGNQAIPPIGTAIHARQTKAEPQSRTRRGDNINWTHDLLSTISEHMHAGLSDREICALVGIGYESFRYRMKIERDTPESVIPPVGTSTQARLELMRQKKALEPPKPKWRPSKEALLAAAEARADAMFAPGYGVPLVKTNDRQCKFATGWEGPRDIGRYLFCGEPTSVGRSFCDHHHAICFRPMEIIGGRIKAKDGKLTEFARVRVEVV